MSSPTFASVLDGVVAVSLIAAATVLLALHDLSQSTALAIYGVAITLVGGSAKALLALRVPTTPAQPQQQPPAPVA